MEYYIDSKYNNQGSKVIKNKNQSMDVGPTKIAVYVLL